MTAHARRMLATIALEETSSPSTPYSYHRLELSASLHVIAILPWRRVVLALLSRHSLVQQPQRRARYQSPAPRIPFGRGLNVTKPTPAYWHWLTGHSLCELKVPRNVFSFGKAGFSIHILLIGFAVPHVGIKILLYILFNGSFFR